MKRLVIVVVAAGLLAASCGGSKSSSSTTTSATSAPASTSSSAATTTVASTTSEPATTVAAAAGPTTPELQSELLTVSNFPTGWASTPVSPSSGGAGSFCNIGVSIKKLQTGTAEADFTQGQLPIFDEQLTGFPRAPIATFNTVISDLTACKSITVSGATLTLARISFPPIGGRSGAFEAAGTIDNTKVAFELVFLLKGKTVMAAIYGGLAPVDTTLVTTLVSEGAARIP